MAKFDRTLTSTFRRIRKESIENKDDAIQLVRKLGNALLEHQQMSSRQAVHIVLSLPLQCSSRKTIFINTSPANKRTCVLKKPQLLAQEPDESEDIMCSSVIDKYIARPEMFASICLAEYVAFYTWGCAKVKKRRKPHIIRYVRFNEHKDPENYYREKILLFVPHRESEETLKQDQHSWYQTYLLHELEICKNETALFPKIGQTWGDINHVATIVENKLSSIFDIDFVSQQTRPSEEIDVYDINTDLHFARPIFNLPKTVKSKPRTSNLLLLLSTTDYYNIRKQLNEEQQSITCDILAKKNNLQTNQFTCS